MPNYWFDHLHLISPDPVKTAEFYEKMFGVRKVIRTLGEGRVLVELTLNGTTVLVSKPRGDSAPFGLGHFGIRTDNLNKAAEELRAKGIRFTQDITEVTPGFKISFVLAPENVPIELQEGSVISVPTSP